MINSAYKIVIVVINEIIYLKKSSWVFVVVASRTIYKVGVIRTSSLTYPPNILKKALQKTSVKKYC